MKKSANYIPDGFHAVTPYLIVKDADRALDFYKRAFAARERVRMPMPDGKIAHAEIQIGDSIVMLGQECPEHGNVSPQTLEGTPVCLTLYVQNVDESFKRALSAGATSKEAVEDKFWGDRAGTLTDPFGHQWMLMTHMEDVPPDEMKKRMEEVFSEMAGQKK